MKTFDFEKFQTTDTVYWLNKYIDGKLVDSQIVYPADLWREEE